MTEFRRPADDGMQRRDALTAALIGLGAALVAALQWYLAGAMDQPHDAPAWLFVLVSAVFAAPLAFRRRWPIPVMVIVSIYYAVAVELGVLEVTVAQVVLFLPFYTVGAWEPRRRAATTSRLIVVIAMGLWLLSSAVRGFTDPETGEYGVQAFYTLFAIQVVINVAYFGAGWVFGDRAWQQALEREALESAQAEVRAQQAQLTEQAISLERLRIARELHDVVAHHVSAMGIQAGAARRVLGRDPDRAAEALRSVEQSSRSAIAELGTIVTALRSQDENDAPMPTLADLRDLVVAAREHGTVRLEIIGDPRPLSHVVELTAYRVVQESLTNVRKHAGPGASADVRLRYLTDVLEVEISDDGAGERKHAAAGLGVGQTGMSERVAAVGGTIEMHGKTRGGYLVRASMPTREGGVVAVREDDGDAVEPLRPASEDSPRTAERAAR